ncbi:stage III sporulation protein AF [Shouchella lonarensis]|uniref:Stage III sporulation protein AF n=1 Tax=Shouchella lonarensis TaxID=1464122 RepID=A0A1G6IDE7_9BACI|nr:stage III sporulation protein AF [Shouchella lonarensis]SDC04521.1 stage III sporulation protein AF [Shouchella lonarensis]
MAFIKEWITAIILIIMLAAILEMMLPNTALKNYVKLVVSLMLLLLLLQPVLVLFQRDIEEWLPSFIDDTAEQQASVGEKINSQKKEIEQFYDAYTSEQVAVQLKEQVAQKLAETYQLEIDNVIIETEGEQEEWKRMVVTVGTVQTEDEPVNKSFVEPVKTVTIDVSSEKDVTVSEREKGLEDEEVKKFLAKEWDVPETFITLVQKDTALSSHR